MFFYLYMVIELVAIFLDSGIIPTAHVVYPVSPAQREADGLKTKADGCRCDRSMIVVHGGLCWIYWGPVLVHRSERFRRLPVRRRWNTHVPLGKPWPVVNRIRPQTTH